MSYLLVMTLWGGAARGITSLPGFETLSACQSAGAAWMVTAKDLEYRNGDVKFTCVPYRLKD